MSLYRECALQIQPGAIAFNFSKTRLPSESPSCHRARGPIYRGQVPSGPRGGARLCKAGGSGHYTGSQGWAHNHCHRLPGHMMPRVFVNYLFEIFNQKFKNPVCPEPCIIHYFVFCCAHLCPLNSAILGAALHRRRLLYVAPSKLLVCSMDPTLYLLCCSAPYHFLTDCCQISTVEYHGMPNQYKYHATPNHTMPNHSVPYHFPSVRCQISLSPCGTLSAICYIYFV